MSNNDKMNNQTGSKPQSGSQNINQGQSRDSKPASGNYSSGSQSSQPKNEQREPKSASSSDKR